MQHIQDQSYHSKRRATPTATGTHYCAYGDSHVTNLHVPEGVQRLSQYHLWVGPEKYFLN
jgi:hypothetical protein